MMHRTTRAASAVLLVALAATPAPAGAKQDKDKPTLCERAYGARMAVIEKHGKRAPGRNICRFGVRSKWNTDWEKDATVKQKAAYLRALGRLTAPPVTRYVRVAAVAPRQPPAGTLTAAARYGDGRFAIPTSIVLCESGGDYRALNPSSGAGGAYQVLPSTWRAFGGSGAPHLASPAEQDRIAAKVWEGQGRGAWVC